MAKWEERFLILCNCGLLYFKKGHGQPQKFKLLNNFMVVPLGPQEEAKQKKQFLFKINFSKEGSDNKKADKNMLIACPNHHERIGWVRALHKYQLQIMEYKMKFFRERLNV